MLHNISTYYTIYTYIVDLNHSCRCYRTSLNIDTDHLHF